MPTSPRSTSIARCTVLSASGNGNGSVAEVSEPSTAIPRSKSHGGRTAPTTQGWGYAVFGEVVEGMDVVEKIKAVATGNRMGHGDVPADDVIIEKAEVVAE